MNTAAVSHAPEISQLEQSEAKKGEKKKIFLPPPPSFSSLSEEAWVRQMKQLS